MTDVPFFAADHPVTLRWTNADGDEVVRPGRVHKVSESAVSVTLRQAVDGEEQLAIGEQVRAEAGDRRGERFAVFRGSVNAIESRLVRIKIDGGIDVQDRRRFRRVHLPFRFTTGIVIEGDQTHYFLAHPIDIGAGGVRFSHRLPLKAGDQFRLMLRFTRDLAISPVGRVIETWEKPPSPTGRQSRTYISRAQFLALLPAERNLIRSYVQWLLQEKERRA